METLAQILEFIQDQILSMKWLSSLVNWSLSMLGVDSATRWGGVLEFFIYDFIKIMILLFVLIFAISYIQSYFPPQKSRQILGKFSGIKANCIAAFLGTVTPFCSCSSVPLFIGFTRAGLPIGVTFSFLISSPMVDLGSIVLLMSIFGWKVALIYVVLGLIVSVVGGTIIQRLKMEKHIKDYIKNGKFNFQIPSSLTPKERLKYANEQVIITVKKVTPYVVVGVGIGAFIHNWIPKEFIQAILGEQNHFGVVMAAFAGAPIYADIFGTIPIAKALLDKGAQLGVVLAFMMSVTTLSLPSIIMLKQAIAPRLLGVFIGICLTGIVIVGQIFNLIENIIK